MMTGENDHNASTEVEELNQGLGNTSLISGKNGWDGLIEGWVTGDRSRREWTTWGGKITGEQTDHVAEGLFESLDELIADQINEPIRQWHCPACRDGVGSIHWFRGMKVFVTHTKTKGSRRHKLHFIPPGEKKTY